jgi:trimethylamine:corrinoid methyltransferase-like protein
VQADTLVAAWAAATIGSLVASIWLLRDDLVWPTRLALRLAKIGLAGALVSIAALMLAGIAYAAGADPAGACGGG